MNCRRLKDQLDTLERETTDKLAQMEQYNKELKVSGQLNQIQDVEDGNDLFNPVSKEFRPSEFNTTKISPGRAASGHDSSSDQRLWKNFDLDVCHP